MQQLKAIVFDCFGVLYPQAAGTFFEKHKELFNNNITVLDELNVKIDLGKITRAELFKGLEAVSGIPAAKIQEEIDSQLHVDLDLIKLIKQLRSDYKIGLLSNAGKEEIDLIYRDKIDHLFDATAVSYEVGSVKPDAEIFLACAERLGVQPDECLFVDDSMNNIEAAQKLSMQAVHYPMFGHIPKELIRLLTVT